VQELQKLEKRMKEVTKNKKKKLMTHLQLMI